MAALLATCASAATGQTLDEARELSDRIRALDAAGRFREAIPLAERALAITERLLGPDHPNTATRLDSLAGLYKDAGAYTKAEPLYVRALAINEAALGPAHANTIASLSNMAELYLLTGDFAKAESLYARAIDSSERHLGPDHVATAIILNGLALVYDEKGAYAEAEPLYGRALAILDKTIGPDHPTTAAALNGQALLYQKTGAYAKAESLYTRAVATFEKALGQRHPRTAQALQNLGHLYETMGSYARAEPLYARALAIAEEAFGTRHPSTANILGGLAGVYFSTGAYDEARPLLTRALAILEETLGPDHPATIGALNNLASLYRETGAYRQALPLFTRAVAVLEKTVGPRHPTTAHALNNLASVYAESGSYAEAEPFLRRALAITEEIVGPNHPDTATRLTNLAGVSRAAGDHADASAMLSRALRIADDSLGPNHPKTVQILAHLSNEEWALNRWSSAAGIIARAEQAGEANIGATLVLGNESRKRSYMQQLNGVAAAIVTFSLAAQGRVAEAEQLGGQVVLRRKGRVLDVMADTMASIRLSLAPDDQAVFERWRGATEQYATLLFRGPERTPAAAYRERLTRLERESAALEAELSQRSTAFRAQVESADIARVQRVIPEAAVLIEWFRYRPFNPAATGRQPSWEAHRYVAYVLRRDGGVAAVDMGAAAPIEVAVSDLRVALADPRSSVVNTLARELYDRLMAPLRPLVGTAEQLLISPDGVLNLLPFGVLIDGRGRHLAETHELTYLTSGRDLLRMNTALSSRQPATIVADPDFESVGVAAAPAEAVDANRRSAEMRGMPRFMPLRGTAEEGAAIQQILGLDARHVLAQGAAREGELKQRRAPRILHLATHGFFLADQRLEPAAVRLDREQWAPVPPGENPLLRSGLALAGANHLRSGQDDGILTALEVSALDLTGTQLVVLSACETGVGQVQSGEGVYGLRRAFVQAGAHTQVASLWKVDDAATRDLMVDYYRRLNSGEGRSTALRSAQRAMLDHPSRRHPYYWAAFVVIGDPRPLDH